MELQGPEVFQALKRVVDLSGPAPRMDVSESVVPIIIVEDARNTTTAPWDSCSNGVYIGPSVGNFARASLFQTDNFLQTKPNNRIIVDAIHIAADLPAGLVVIDMVSAAATGANSIRSRKRFSANAAPMQAEVRGNVVGTGPAFNQANMILYVPSQTNYVIRPLDPWILDVPGSARLNVSRIDPNTSLIVSFEWREDRRP